MRSVAAGWRGKTRCAERGVSGEHIEQAAEQVVVGLDHLDSGLNLVQRLLLLDQGLDQIPSGGSG